MNALTLFATTRKDKIISDSDKMREPAEPKLSLADLRLEYTFSGLTETDADPDPFVQFQRWFSEAKAANLREPNAMTLATTTREGYPSARIVLLKDFSADGLVFHTNYDSRKGQELAVNPNAALVFYWAELERQVRVEGVVDRIPRPVSEDYFRGRPKGSKLGAIASRQSRVIPNRQVLEDKLAELQDQYRDRDDIAVPEFWGGMRLIPRNFEFWQGRPNRLHDRLRYQKEGGAWTIDRLSP